MSQESGTSWHNYCDSLLAGARPYIPSAEEKAPGPQGTRRPIQIPFDHVVNSVDVVALYPSLAFFPLFSMKYGLRNYVNEGTCNRLHSTVLSVLKTSKNMLNL